MEVTIDTNKLKGKNLSEIGMDDLQSIMLDAEQEALEEVAQEDSTMTLGAIGAPYMVGPIDITIAIGNLVLLHEIDSPFLKDLPEGEELDVTACINSLYVLALGKEALKPVMAIKQRVQSLMLLKPMVESNEKMFDSLLDRAEAIADAHVQFDIDALKWYEENYAGCEFQGVINETFVALSDVMKAAHDMPVSDGKKKHSR